MRGASVGWLAALVIGCAGAARPGAPVAMDYGPPIAATPAVVTPSVPTPEPACEPIEVPPGLEPRGADEESDPTDGASFVGHERIDVDATGCITIGPQLATERVRVRRLPRPRLLSESRLPPRGRVPDHYDGADLDGLYAAFRMDATGHWRPSADGGFERVSSCR